MKISIAMATYNGAEYLQEQLDSFVTQTQQPDELVVTDDCSTDATLAMLESFASTAPFEVVVHRNERNYGYCGNFNQALMRCSGDLVFLCDQDDVWFPEKIERVAVAADEYPESLVILNDAALTHGDLSETGLTKMGQIKSAGLDEPSFVMGCCAAVKRDLLDLCLPIPVGFPAHDTWIVGIADGMNRKHVLADVLQYYRRHGSNESQFIANRTIRVGWWDKERQIWRERLAELLGKAEKSGTSEPDGESPQAVMHEWAQSTLPTVPTAYEQDFRVLIERTGKQVSALKRRGTIRSRPFPTRLRGVVSAQRDGTYVAFSGWKSALRDLVGERRA